MIEEIITFWSNCKGKPIRSSNMTNENIVYNDIDKMGGGECDMMWWVGRGRVEGWIVEGDTTSLLILNQLYNS